MALMAGCGSSQQTVVPLTQLATARPASPLLVTRARVQDLADLADLGQPLTDDYMVLVIRSPGELTELRRRVAMEGDAHPDFSQGILVGVAASLGEPAAETWPVHLNAVRTRSGLGWLEVRIDPGLYHPVRAPAYIELAYVPSLRAVAVVQVNERVFLLPGRAGDPPVLIPGNAPP